MGKMVFLVIGWMKYFMSILLFGIVIYVVVYGIFYVYILYYLVNLVVFWLVIFYFILDFWLILGLKYLYEGDVEDCKGGKEL